MQLTLLTDSESWINKRIDLLTNPLRELGHTVRQIHKPSDLANGDLCFILSCSSIIPANLLELHQHNLVVHASDLPKGKGWSPLTWQIIEGKSEITITLFEAVPDKVDAGTIFLQKTMRFKGDELVDELRDIQAVATFDLCIDFVRMYPEIIKKGKAQVGTSSYYSKRKPKDSELDPRKSIIEQFNLLRTVDNDKYPAYFMHMGRRYNLLTVSGKTLDFS